MPCTRTCWIACANRRISFLESESAVRRGCRRASQSASSAYTLPTPATIALGRAASRESGVELALGGIGERARPVPAADVRDTAADQERAKAARGRLDLRQLRHPEGAGGAWRATA